MNKKLLKVAEDIIKLEIQINNGFCTDTSAGVADVAQVLSEMDRIVSSLTPEEMYEVDNYIQEVMKKCDTEL